MSDAGKNPQRRMPGELRLCSDNTHIKNSLVCNLGLKRWEIFHSQTFFFLKTLLVFNERKNNLRV